MAGQRPLFVSAPRLILGIEDSSGRFNRLAYAIGMSLRVSVNVVPVTVCGSFAPVSYEPVQYMPVTATLQIIRLQKKAYRDARVKNAKETVYNDNKMVDPATIKTLDSYAWSADTVSNTGSLKNPSNSIVEQAEIFKHLDPLNILTSESFDIKVYLNIGGSGDQLSFLDTKTSLVKDNIAKDTVFNDLVPFMTIKDCRITGRSVNIAQGQLLNEPCNVMGLLAVHSAETFDDITKEGIVS